MSTTTPKEFVASISAKCVNCSEIYTITSTSDVQSNILARVVDYMLQNLKSGEIEIDEHFNVEISRDFGVTFADETNQAIEAASIAAIAEVMIAGM